MDPVEDVATQFRPRAPLVVGLDRETEGASHMSVAENISSLASENSTHFSRDFRSIGLSFQRLSGSCARS